MFHCEQQDHLEEGASQPQEELGRTEMFLP